MIWWALFLGLGVAYCFYRVDGHINAMQSRMADLEHALSEVQHELRRIREDADRMQRDTRTLGRRAEELASPFIHTSEPV